MFISYASRERNMVVATIQEKCHNMVGFKVINNSSNNNIMATTIKW